MKLDFTRGTQETKDGIQLSICHTLRKKYQPIKKIQPHTPPSCFSTPMDSSNN